MMRTRQADNSYLHLILWHSYAMQAKEKVCTYSNDEQSYNGYYSDDVGKHILPAFSWRNLLPSVTVHISL